VRAPTALALVLALAAAGCSGAGEATETVTVTAPPRTEKQGVGPPAEQVEFGHIRTLTRRGDAWRMRFDPEWFLSGETANEAAAEDGAVEPGEPVPNDNYRVEEGHRLLTYLVPDDAEVTVLTRHGDPARFGATPIRVAELDRVLRGTSNLRLFEPLDTGVWLTVHGDTVRSVDQQYQP
jgi:hypothetical protein